MAACGGGGHRDDPDTFRCGDGGGEGRLQGARMKTFIGWAVLAALFAFIFATIAASVVFSFNADRFPTLPLVHFTTDWYARAFSRPEVWQAIGNSLIVAGGASANRRFNGFATAFT